MKAFSGTEYGEEYLSFGQNERICRSSTLKKGGHGDGWMIAVAVGSPKNSGRKANKRLNPVMHIKFY